MDSYTAPERDMDTYLDAVHDVAFDCHPKTLASDIGMSVKSLYRRLAEDDPMPMRLIDFVGIFWSVDREHQMRLIAPFLDHLGMVAVPRCEKGEVSRGDVFASVLNAQQGQGVMAALIQAAIADGEIDDKEAAQLEAQHKAIEQQMSTLMGQLKAMRKPLKVVGK
ncbi:hypothetical protein KP05_16705 [Cobetia amphilecti]|uniref:phage regulatory CII family protein n=1 Tax=Cobetia amphilecti TaxID=1055104 RepID=UPI0005001B34|nr:DUF533 domain-containing protein [Cobetia amphilecti]KGA00854.1 hypothetical protein KP05_16705 [Cobetia amphilecti]